MLLCADCLRVIFAQVLPGRLLPLLILCSELVPVLPLLMSLCCLSVQPSLTTCRSFYSAGGACHGEACPSMMVPVRDGICEAVLVENQFQVFEFVGIVSVPVD